MFTTSGHKLLINSIIHIIFILLLFNFAYSSLNWANSINPIPEFKTYEFEARATNQVIFNQFLIEYDFNTNKGNISMKLSPFLVDEVYIELPPEILINGITVHDGADKRELLEGNGYTTSLQPDNFTNFINIRKSKVKSIGGAPPIPAFVQDIILDISRNNFYPNGNFKLDLQKARPQSLRTFLRFNLGKFECGVNCFLDYNGKLGHFTEGEKLNIHLIDDRNEGNNIGYKWFIINTIDTDKLNLKQLLGRLGTGLFVAGFVLLAQLGIMVAYYFGKKTIKNETY